VTVIAQDPDFAAASQQLDVLCRKVGLNAAAQLPASMQKITPPGATALWSSAYAHLLMWPVDGVSGVLIERSAIEAEGWFDEFLGRGEAAANGRPVDGYLVLALPNTPAADASDEIRKLELSSRICRKHLIWPAKAENGVPPLDRWCRVADVTVLGLPEAAMAGTSELYWPKIDADAEAVWNDLLVHGPAATAQRDEAA
jgi:hypothetical protein